MLRLNQWALVLKTAALWPQRFFKLESKMKHINIWLGLVQSCAIVFTFMGKVDMHMPMGTTGSSDHNDIIQQVVD